jgi:hypothetical protein
MYVFDTHRHHPLVPFVDPQKRHHLMKRMFLRMGVFDTTLGPPTGPDDDPQDLSQSFKKLFLKT